LKINPQNVPKTFNFLKSSISYKDKLDNLSKVIKDSKSFEIIVNEVTMVLDLPECPKYFLRLPTCYRNSTSFTFNVY